MELLYTEHIHLFHLFGNCSGITARFTLNREKNCLLWLLFLSGPCQFFFFGIWGNIFAITQPPGISSSTANNARESTLLYIIVKDPPLPGISSSTVNNARESPLLYIIVKDPPFIHYLTTMYQDSRLSIMLLNSPTWLNYLTVMSNNLKKCPTNCVLFDLPRCDRPSWQFATTTVSLDEQEWI